MLLSGCEIKSKIGIVEDTGAPILQRHESERWAAVTGQWLEVAAMMEPGRVSLGQLCHGVRRRSELRLQQRTAKVIGELWGGSGRVFVWIGAFGVCDDTSFLGPMMRQSIELVNQSNERASNQSLARKM